MPYVLDTNSWRVFGNYYPATFPRVWKQLKTSVGAGDIISVWEAYKELEFQNASLHLATWTKAHKDIFFKPTSEECRS